MNLKCLDTNKWTQSKRGNNFPWAERAAACDHSAVLPKILIDTKLHIPKGERVN